MDYRILIQKIEHYGVIDISKKWFSSYVTNRKQFMSIDNCSSTTKKILAGVPPGSVLGPLLFLTYMNEIHNCVKYSKVHYITGDTKILLFGKSLEVLTKKLNQHLKNLLQGLKANKLSLNVKKVNQKTFAEKQQILIMVLYLN